MPLKCNACGRFTNAAEGVKCVKCGNCVTFYHRACVNIPKDAKVAPTWVCPGCKAQTPRKDNSDNPVRGEGADYGSPQESSPNVTSIEILKEVRLMREEMTFFRGDFTALRESLGVLQGIVEGFGGRMDSMESRLGCLEQRCLETQASPEVTDMLATIEQLKSDLNDRDQEAFQNDVEITGIPEEQNENAGHLAIVIAEKLGVSCDERDFVSAERVGVRRAPSSGEQPAASVSRPRPLVVRLARRHVRDALLQGARVRRGLTTEGMAIVAAPTKFYVNERLSRHNNMLFFKAREEARSHGWKFVWTRGGRIYVRRETGKASHRVRSEDDLGKIFASKNN